jgi:hypothetical protein
MRATPTLLLLVLALVATGGEARAGDGISGRQLLTNPKPEHASCRDSNCNKVLKYGCDWLPKADLKCDAGGKYEVAVKNCFAKKIGYITISAGGKCNKYSTYGGDIITKLYLKCGDEIKIYASGRDLKGDGSTACGDDNSRMAGRHCKTCKFTAKYKCPYAGHPGDMCRKAYGDCDLPSYYDKKCQCPLNELRGATYVCRNSTGPCDDGAKCTGKDAMCPLGGYKPDTTVCRASTGPCDKAEYCTGKSGDCPEDRFEHHKVCRPSAGPCDAPEFCYKGKCPDDEFLPKYKLCGKSKGECEEDAFCSGHSALCPANEFRKNTTVCRKSDGDCDLPEYCTGKDSKCPTNAYAPKTVLCRPADGKCDAPEFCTGSDAKCPPDMFKPKTEMCREKDGDCDVADYCSGYSPKCEDLVEKRGTVCREAAGPCDAAEYCDGYRKRCPKDFCVDYRKELKGPYCPVAKPA